MSDNESSHYCTCKRPRVKTKYDDLGRPVDYCALCWRPIADRPKNPSKKSEVKP